MKGSGKRRRGNLCDMRDAITNFRVWQFTRLALPPPSEVVTAALWRSFVSPLPAVLPYRIPRIGARNSMKSAAASEICHVLTSRGKGFFINQDAFGVHCFLRCPASIFLSLASPQISRERKAGGKFKDLFAAVLNNKAAFRLLKDSCSMKLCLISRKRAVFSAVNSLQRIWNVPRFGHVTQERIHVHKWRLIIVKRKIQYL